MTTRRRHNRRGSGAQLRAAEQLATDRRAQQHMSELTGISINSADLSLDGLVLHGRRSRSASASGDSEETPPEYEGPPQVVPQIKILAISGIDMIPVLVGDADRNFRSLVPWLMVIMQHRCSAMVDDNRIIERHSGKNKVTFYENMWSATALTRMLIVKKKAKTVLTPREYECVVRERIAMVDMPVAITIEPNRVVIADVSGNSQTSYDLKELLMMDTCTRNTHVNSENIRKFVLQLKETASYNRDLWSCDETDSSDDSDD